MQHDQYRWNNSLSRSYPKHFWQGKFAPWKQVWGLQLRACDDQDCIECIEWIYTVDNIDSTPMTITIVDHAHNGITDSLIDQLPTTNLAVGESTGLNETQKVNICIKQLITTLLNAEANPPAGLPCFDSNMYALQPRALVLLMPSLPALRIALALNVMRLLLLSNSVQLANCLRLSLLCTSTAPVLRKAMNKTMHPLAKMPRCVQLHQSQLLTLILAIFLVELSWKAMKSQSVLLMAQFCP
jgi:hypothetical protein